MDTTQIVRLADRALRAAINHDADRAQDYLVELGATGDPDHLYAACGLLAEEATRAVSALHGHTPGQCNALWIVREAKPGALQDNPANTFAARFVAAHANADLDTTLALYLAALDAGRDAFSDSVRALLAYTAHLHRRACTKRH
jgi:hypothetical protein